MDQAAFRSFYQKTAPALRAYIARSAGSVHAADDILQDVFMRFLAKAPSGLSEAERRGYLYRTADTLIIDRWRQSQRENRRNLAAARTDQDVGTKRDFDDDVNQAFRKLKSQQRTLLWMAYVDELDHREIARVAGVHEKSVRVLLSRARKAFAGALKRFSSQAETTDGK